MSSSEAKPDTTLGVVVLVILGYAVYLLGSLIYHWFAPVPSFSLAVSAWFEPAASGGAPQLRVAGVVLKDGKPATEERVRLAIEDWTKGIRQSVFLEVNTGHFDSGNQPAFQSIMPADRLHIRAEYGKGGTSISEEVYLGARVPHVSMRTALIVLGSVILVSLGFLWLFTGRPRPGKNVWAIIISYVVMAVFLGAPLVLPAVLSVMSPDIMAIMRETPVGVLIADPKEGNLGRQWVLNIGGSVVASGQVATSLQTTTVANRTVPQGQTPAASAATQASETSPAPATPTPASTKPPAQPTTAQAPSTAPSGTVQQSPGDESVVEIQGGVVIPLYVLILSVIGGAINMTLKLPDFQREAASLDLSPRRAMTRIISVTSQTVSAAFDQLKNVSGKMESSEQKPPEAPETSAGQTESAIASQAEPTATETDDLLRQTSEWRKGLITQHMYLLSAPFLAIAVYYLLVWLKVLNQPALVLVSFSVGLISDKIVGKITGVAGDIVGGARPTSGTPSGTSGTPDKKP